MNKFRVLIFKFNNSLQVTPQKLSKENNPQEIQLCDLLRSCSIKINYISSQKYNISPKIMLMLRFENTMSFLNSCLWQFILKVVQVTFALKWTIIDWNIFFIESIKCICERVQVCDCVALRKTGDLCRKYTTQQQPDRALAGL